MADARTILLNLFGKETISPAAKKAGDALEDMGDDAETTARKARKLDKDAEDLTKSLAALAASWVAAGSAAEKADIAKSIRVDKAKLRETMNMRKLMGGIGEDGAGGFVTGFVARLGPLVVSKMPMALNPAVAAAAAGPAAVLAVTLGTAVAGGIIGGTAGVGVVGGLAIAAKHSSVQNAATLMADQIGKSLQRSAVAMVPAALEGIGIIRSEFGKAEKDLTKLFSASAKFIKPLAQAGGAAFRDVLAGVATLADRASPVIDAIAGGIRRIGAAIRVGLEDLSDNANEGARALALLFTVVDYGIRAAFGLVNAFAEVYGWMEKVSGLLRGDASPILRDYYEDQMAVSEGASGLSAELEGLLSGFTGATTAAQNHTAAIRDQLAALTSLEDATQSQRNAVWDLKDAMAGLEAQTRKYGTSLDENTPKGRENLRYFDDMLTKADAAGDAAEQLALANGASAEAAAAAGARVRETWIKDLIAAGTKAGFSKKEIEKLVAAARAADGERIRIYYDQIFRMFGKPYSDVTGIGGNSYRGLSRGGPVEGPGPKGVDSQPYMLAPGEHVLTADEVDAAGGHAAIKAWRSGLRNPSTVRPSLATAGVSGVGGGGGATVVNFYNNGVIGSRLELQNWLTKAFDDLRRRGRV